MSIRCFFNNEKYDTAVNNIIKEKHKHMMIRTRLRLITKEEDKQVLSPASYVLENMKISKLSSSFSLNSIASHAWI
ncbi:hypothetical protein VNO78_08636 [Psophocarpus tetragonolobus]|uniref:Uncharacterized protein n=1 Tax=Psophocarpus tetragonolobus TaxID=3891 RepID=A0AAN9T5K3_PSOTE